MGHKLEQNKVVNSRTDFFYYMFRNVLLLSIPLLIVSGLVLSHLSFHSSATNSTATADQVFITLSTSCTMSSELVNPHTVDINGGQHKENIGTTKISTFCNDNNGYNIYAIGYSNNTDGNTDLVGNLGDNYNIHTGIYNSNNPSSSSWGMKLTAGIGTGINPDTGESITVTPPTINNSYNNYNVVPNVYTLVASRASGTNMNEDINADITGSYFTTTYDIYTSSIQPPDTYMGKVKYILTHPSTNAPSTINDLDAAFIAAGKQKVYQDSNGSYYAMQDITSDICNSVTRTGELTTTQLVDIRDNNLYYVTKLADGKCWMTENLDLDIGGANTTALTSENTDISTTASGSGIYTDGYTQDNGVWTWSPVSTAITPNYTISGIAVSPVWPTNNYITPYSAEGGDTYYYTSNTTGDDMRYNSLQACTNANHTEAECKHYSAGNYYNWTAAIASNNSTNISTNNTQAANSICPKGWRLPNASQTDNVNNEFGRMLYYSGITVNLSNGNNSVGYTANGFNKLRSNPYYFVRSGGISGNTLYNSGVFGDYWSSTVINSTDAYRLGFNNTDIYPARNYNRHGGRSVRCIAR